jgi:hypothetical protein
MALKKIVPMMKAANQSMRSWYSEDLRKHDQLMNLLETFYKVHLEDNEQYPEKLAWCLKYCQSKFRDIKYGDGMYWYFQSEQDASLFSLKWAG